RFLPVPGRSDLTAAVMHDQPNGPGTNATVGTFGFTTFLNTTYYRPANALDYIPAANFAAGYVLQLFAFPTATVPATRTVNGVTGRGIQVYLPRGYFENTNRRYPVLYMHDGQNVFAPGGPFGCWFAEQSATFYITRAQMRELIIVAIDN